MLREHITIDSRFGDTARQERDMIEILILALTAIGVTAAVALFALTGSLITQEEARMLQEKPRTKTEGWGR